MEAEATHVSAAKLRIVTISNEHGFLLLSHDLNMGYSWVFMQKSMTNSQDRCQTAACSVDNTHVQAHALINPAENTHGSRVIHALTGPSGGCPRYIMSFQAFVCAISAK